MRLPASPPAERAACGSVALRHPSARPGPLTASPHRCALSNRCPPRSRSCWTRPRTATRRRRRRSGSRSPAGIPGTTSTKSARRALVAFLRRLCFSARSGWLAASQRARPLRSLQRRLSALCALRGEPCTVVDLILNGDILKQAIAYKRLKARPTRLLYCPPRPPTHPHPPRTHRQVFVIELALNWVAQKHTLLLDPKYKLPRRDYFGGSGEPEAQVVRSEPKCAIAESQPSDRAMERRKQRSTRLTAGAHRPARFRKYLPSCHSRPPALAAARCAAG